MFTHIPCCVEFAPITTELRRRSGSTLRLYSKHDTDGLPTSKHDDGLPLTDVHGTFEIMQVMCRPRPLLIVIGQNIARLVCFDVAQQTFIPIFVP